MCAVCNECPTAPACDAHRCHPVLYVQTSALRRGVDVIVGTPGRIIDHIDRGNLDVSQLKYLVLDEADQMLDMGFKDDMEVRATLLRSVLLCPPIVKAAVLTLLQCA